MRRQLQRTTMVVAFIAVVGYALPMMYVTITGLQGGARQQLEQRAHDLARHIWQRVAQGEPIDTNYLVETAGDIQQVRVEYRDADIEIGDGEPGNLVATAAAGEVRVTLWGSDAALQGAMLQVLALSFAYGGLAAIAAWFIARRYALKLERPIAELVDAANRIGLGDARARRRRYGIPELDKVAEVLDQVSGRIQRLLLVERQLGSEMSHQLRTPLTALQLQIDEILESAEDPVAVRQEAERASRQIDRLTQVMTDLVSARRGLDEPRGVAELAELVAPVLSENRLALANLGRKLSVDLPPGLQTGAAAGAVRHIVAILLENAVEHGEGLVRLSAVDAGEWLVLRVTDEGAGLSPAAGASLEQLQQEFVPRGTDAGNIGLPLAVALVVGQGGRIEWRESEPAALRVYLPSVPEDPAAIGIEAE